MCPNILVFSLHQQLCSGHWRAPVRSLPIRPSLNLAQLNSVPQVYTRQELLSKDLQAADDT